MTVQYTIFPNLKFAYVKGTESLTGHEIITQGPQLFEEPDWVNGFSILLDYRNVETFDMNSEEVLCVVQQDQCNESRFDQSKCAIIAEHDVVFGFSRMWEALSENTQIETRVLRRLDEALEWLEIDPDAFQAAVTPPELAP